MASSLVEKPPPVNYPPLLPSFPSQPPTAISYAPLSDSEDIRFIILQPGSGSDAIVCRLVHAELWHTKYELVSGEWNYVSIYDREIVLDGQEVQIQKNLYDALWNLRLEFDELCLWIHAICVNQLDVLEKNHAVETMGMIYRQSQNTIIWLGEANTDNESAMDKLVEFEYVKSQGRSQIPTMSVIEGIIDTSDVDPGKVIVLTPKLQRDTIFAMAKHSYWSRIWTIQKILRSRKLTLCCGSKSIPLLSFFSFLELAPTKCGSENCDCNLRNTPAFFLLNHRYDQNRSREYTLYYWLNVCLTVPKRMRVKPSPHFRGPFTYAEPREIVYALLGASSDYQNGELKADYAKPLIDIYMDVYKILRRVKPKVTPDGYHDMERFPQLEMESYPIDVENNLAFSFGLINESRRITNCRHSLRKSTRRFGHLLGPLGRFQFALWNTADSIAAMKPVVRVCNFFAFMWYCVILPCCGIRVEGMM